MLRASLSGKSGFVYLSTRTMCTVCFVQHLNATAMNKLAVHSKLQLLTCGLITNARSVSQHSDAPCLYGVSLKPKLANKKHNANNMFLFQASF